jgi:ABC-type nitrate/sulfonate/bicarbonate transport system substrate-binding protein
MGPSKEKTANVFAGAVLAGLVSLLFLAFAVSASFAEEEAGNKVVVREGFPSKVAAFWPVYAASALGLFAKEGIDLEDVITDPNVTVSALMGGSVQISYADSTQLLLALDKGANLVAVGLSTDRQPYRLMAAPTIKTIADLKGKKIGAASAIDIYTYVLKEILRKANLDPDKDVEWVVGGGQNQRLAAIMGGAIQAGLFSPPSDARLKGAGFNALAFTPDYYPNLTLSAQTVRRDWAQQNGDTLRHVLRAQAEAVKWLNDPSNKAQAIEILAKAINASPADAEDAYGYYIGQHVWPDACIHAPGLVNVVKIMHVTHQLKTITEADVPKFVDPEWCTK